MTNDQDKPIYPTRKELEKMPGYLDDVRRENTLVMQEKIWTGERQTADEVRKDDLSRIVTPAPERHGLKTDWSKELAAKAEAAKPMRPYRRPARDHDRDR